MAIHAEAVEILVRKSRFEPEEALGIAEAIEASITLAQLVTVPVLDARLQELKAEIQTTRAEIRAELATGLGKLEAEIHKVNANLMRWVLLTMLGSATLSMAGKAIMKTLGY
ncbi:MAG TPA: hypothetical protein VGI23_27765 [Steroidobacteraceae bacterium]